MNTIRTTNADDAGDHTSPAARPSFDVRTSPEGLAMWCAHLEMQNEDLAGRVRHLELSMFNLLNTAIKPLRPVTKSLAAEVIAGGAASAILAYINRDEPHSAAQALDMLQYATENAVYITMNEDGGTPYSAQEIASGYWLLRRQLEKEVQP